jgi:hypothetical protein
MAQVGQSEDGSSSIMECTQADCSIRGTQSKPDEPIVLLPEFLHLLDPDRPDI